MKLFFCECKKKTVPISLTVHHRLPESLAALRAFLVALAAALAAIECGEVGSLEPPRWPFSDGIVYGNSSVLQM